MLIVVKPGMTTKISHAKIAREFRAFMEGASVALVEIELLLGERDYSSPWFARTNSVVKYLLADALLCSISSESETCGCGLLEGKGENQLALVPKIS